MQRKFKRVLGVLFIVFTLMCLMAVSASAEVYSGECGVDGGNVTWSFDTESKELIISGEGEMADFESNRYDISSNTPWYSYNPSKVIIKDGVTRIGDNAFRGCTNIEEIQIGTNVSVIGVEAFGNLSNISSIEIPENVTTIEAAAFYNCKNLITIMLPSNITSIEMALFENCYKLTNINIPENVTFIGERAFDDCSSLTTINIPEKVVTIEEEAFNRCTKLKEIYIPDSVSTIGEYAFYGCENVTSVVVGNGITSIPTMAFHCYNLKTIVLGSGITTIQQNAFYDCRNIKNIHYADSSDNWSKITIESQTYSNFASATKHYNCKYTGRTYATCSEAGYSDGFYCSNCGWIVGHKVLEDAKGHEKTKIISNIPSTCTAEGSTVFWCGVCQLEIKETIAPIEHSFTSYESSATCTTNGIKTSYCDYGCGEKDTTYVYATGHSFTNYVSDNNATCTKDGTKTAKCDNCVETKTVTDLGSRKGHSFTNYISDDNATCTKDGTKTAKCDNCVETKTVTDLGSRKGHSFTNYISDNNATCTKNGTKTAKCDNNCGLTDTVTDYGSATGHSYEEVIYNPTCTENGYIEYTCHCGRHYTETIEATGHDFEGSKCKNCPFDRATECSCNCHAGGIKTFFFNFINFFQKLFGQNKICTCGANH